MKYDPLFWASLGPTNQGKILYFPKVWGRDIFLSFPSKHGDVI